MIAYAQTAVIKLRQALTGPVRKNTTSEAVAAPTESGVLSCPNSGAGRGLSAAVPHGFGWGGPTRKDGRAASDAFLTPHPPYALKNANGGFVTPEGAETMPTGNITTTPTMGNSPASTKFGLTLSAAKRPSHSRDRLATQQAIENHLSAALFHVRHADGSEGFHVAVGRAIRAASLLKQACVDMEYDALVESLGGASHV